MIFARIRRGVNHLLTIRQANFETKQTEAAKAAAPAEEPIAQTLRIDDLKIELGYALTLAEHVRARLGRQIRAE